VSEQQAAARSEPGYENKAQDCVKWTVKNFTGSTVTTLCQAPAGKVRHTPHRKSSVTHTNQHSSALWKFDARYLRPIGNWAMLRVSRRLGAVHRNQKLDCSGERVKLVVGGGACHRGSDLLLVAVAFRLLLGGHCSGIWRRSHATTIVGHRRWPRSSC
jgi:hypothetical protein